ncbi:hypothetical protein VTH06DRAFT_2828 [Thermothelomyces fergusii]|jgi:hypothetical protein
MSSY